MQPAGPEKAIGMLSTAYVKDPTDPSWQDDADMKEWRAFMAKYLPSGDTTDAATCSPMGSARPCWQVLQQCKGDFSRPNVMQQAENLHDMEQPILLPGIKLNTSPHRAPSDHVACSSRDGTARPGCASAT